MKKICLMVLILVLANNLFAQNAGNKPESLKLRKPTSLPINSQVEMMKEFILKYYGKSFIYYEELKSGEYKLSYNINSPELDIIDGTTDRIVDKVKLRKGKSSESSLNIASGFSNGKYELKISLPKYTYKQFEPVKVMIEMMNHDSDTLELWGNFEPPLYFAGARITDQIGNVFDENQSYAAKFDMSYNTPTNIIQPGDTLYLTMSINDWGKEARFVSLKDNDIYFGNRGYFENGKYTAHISTTIKTDSGWDKRVIIKSNDVNFEVVGLNDTDKEILNLFKEADFLYNIKPYKDAIDRFPDNPFTEHVYTYYLGGKYLNYFSDKNYKYINDLETEYQNFISKYPNSVYLLDPRFIEPYLYKYFMDLNTNEIRDNFEQQYLEFQFQNKDNMLKHFLRDKSRSKMILHLQ